jgi:hypothetical protein
MLAFLILGSAYGISLRHHVKEVLRLDPHCSEGIMNTEMTACCMADCGECSDTSDLCDAGRQAEKGTEKHGRESTCCPATMLAGDLPSCENSMAPCAIPESVRNPADLSSLTAADRHAKDDCGDAIKATDDHHHLQTAYLKFASKEFKTKTEHGGCVGTADCGSYGTMEQAAAACSNNDDCLGFDATADGSPDCLFMADDKLMTLVDSSTDMYVKREYHFTGRTFGIRMVNHKCYCKDPKGAFEVKLGFCSSQILMNDADGADVYPDVPRAACEPTPAPTPSPTPSPTPGPTPAPEEPMPASSSCADASGAPLYNVMNCATYLASLNSFYGSTPEAAMYYAEQWPGDDCCDTDLIANNACGNDCGDCR